MLKNGNMVMNMVIIYDCGGERHEYRDERL